jgi:hypothetical protein
MKVYVLTEGEYSDYHIEAVFADRAMAERFGEVRFGGAIRAYSPRVEERDVLTEMPTTQRAYYIRQNISVPGGPAGDPQEWHVERWSHETSEYAARIPERSEVTVGKCDGGVTVTVYAATQEAARKAFHDRVAHIMAEAEGVA